MASTFLSIKMQMIKKFGFSRNNVALMLTPQYTFEDTHSDRIHIVVYFSDVPLSIV